MWDWTFCLAVGCLRQGKAGRPPQTEKVKFRGSEAHTSGKKSSDTCPNLCLLSVLVSRNDFGPTDPSAKVSGFPSYALKPTPPRRGGAIHSSADPPSSHQWEKMHLGVFISAAQVPPCQFQCTLFMKRLIQGNWCGSLDSSLLRFPPLRVLSHSCFLLQCSPPTRRLRRWVNKSQKQFKVIAVRAL